MDPKKQVISITTGTMVRALAVGAAALVLWRLWTLALLLLSAIVIASAAEPGVQFFIRRKFPRALAVVLVYVLVIALLAILVWFFIPPMLSEASISVLTAASAALYTECKAPVTIRRLRHTAPQAMHT